MVEKTVNSLGSWRLRLLVVMLLSCNLGWAVESAAFSGAGNGYAYDGDEPICLKSISAFTPIAFNSTPPLNSTFLEGGDLPPSSPMEYTEFFNEVESSVFSTGPTSIFQRCPNGTEISLSALDLHARSASVVPGTPESQNLMFTQTPYTFRINFEMDTKTLIAPNHSVEALFVRFMMCDLVSGGWCSPIFDGPIIGEAVRLTLNSTENVIYGFYNYTHRFVASNWALVDLDDTNDTVVRVEDLDVSFQLTKRVPSRYFRIYLHTALHLAYVDDITLQTVVHRIDSAALGDPSTVLTRELPKTVQVSDQMKVLIYCMIAIFGTLAAVTLGFLIYYREHPAIQLAQGAFLQAIVVAALVGGTFTFSFIPENDAYCQMRAPLVHIPFHLIGSILAARQWRTYVVLSGAMKLGKGSGRKSSRSSLRTVRTRCLERIVDVMTLLSRFDPVTRQFRRCRCRRNQEVEEERRRLSSMRQTVTAGDSARVVFFLVFPQAVLIILGLALDPVHIEMDYDEDENVARSSCRRSAMWLSSLTSWLTAGSYVLALLLAWVGTDLPSLFNEKQAIFNTSLIFALVLFINIVVLTSSQDISSSPDTTVFVISFTLLAALVVLFANIVWPKIIRAQRNEKVVLGDVLRLQGPKHEKQQEEANQPTMFMSRLIQHKDDPMPRNIEELVHRLRKLFASIADKCGYGTPLSRNEWQEMMRNVSKLNTELARVTLDWDDGVINENGVNPPNNIVEVDEVENGGGPEHDILSGVRTHETGGEAVEENVNDAEETRKAESVGWLDSMISQLTGSDKK